MDSSLSGAPTHAFPSLVTPIRLVFEVEILTCPDTGRDELVASFADRAADTITPAQAHALIAAARAQLDQAEAMVSAYAKAAAR